jgi:hypothetical protein
LPKGLVEYIGEGEASEIDAGRCNLKAIEHTLSALLDHWTYKTVVDAYRRDLSGIGTATQLAELLCEIALCASIENLSETLQLRPATGKGTHSDFLAKINAYELYGESKRYEDPWPCSANPHEPVIPKVPYKRSITQKFTEQRPTDSACPRSMDLRNKLQNVPRQFPDQTLNILFVFHRSFVGESRSYMTQTLLGDANFFSAENTCALESDGLFAIEEWRFAADQGEIHRDVIDVPLSHEHNDPKPEDRGMVLAQARFVGHRVLGPTLALEHTVAHQIQDVILGGRKRLHGLVGEPPEQRLRAPVCGTQQPTIVLAGQMRWPMPS